MENENRDNYEKMFHDLNTLDDNLFRFFPNVCLLLFNSLLKFLFF